MDMAVSTLNTLSENGWLQRSKRMAFPDILGVVGERAPLDVMVKQTQLPFSCTSKSNGKAASWLSSVTQYRTS